MFYKVKAITVLALSASLSLAHAKTWEIDSIVARINGVNLLQSHLKSPRITKEGNPFTLEEAILEELTYQKAAETQMLPTTLDIDRHLVAFKIQNHLTDLSESAFEQELKQHGFTLRTYKQQLGRMIAVENVRRAEMSEKLLVTTQEIEEYFKKNPKYSREEFKLTMCIIPEEHVDNAADFLAGTEATWEDLGWIAKKELGENFAEAKTMKKGEVSDPIKVGNSHQVIKLIDKHERRLKTLDERYSTIERSLREKKKASFIKVFDAELRSKASIILL